MTLKTVENAENGAEMADIGLFGSTEPRIWTPRDPVRYPKTALPLAEAFAEAAGLATDEWQRLLLSGILELHPTAVVDRNDERLTKRLDRDWPKWAHRVITYVLARQNGKTRALAVRVGVGLFLIPTDGRITHTAQDRQVPRDTFEELTTIIENSRSLRRRLAKRRGIVETNGREQINLKNGSKYRIKAPTPKVWHGPPNDVIIIDEIRFAATDLWGSGYPSQSARPNPQIIACSNAGKADAVQLAKLQKRGRAAADDPASDPEMFYAEWSAHEDRKPDDPKGWAEANPTLGRRITMDTVRDELIELEADDFETERLSRTVLTVSTPAIKWDQWRECGGEPTPITDADLPRPQAAIHLSGDQTRGALSIAAVRDNRMVVEVAERWLNVDGINLTDVAAYVIAFMRTNRITDLAYDRRRSAFIADRVADVGFDTHRVDATERIVASQAINDAITNTYLLHSGDPLLDAEVRRAGRQDFKDDTWMLSEAESGGDISGVMAMAFAVNLAYRQPATTGGIRWVD